MRLAPSYLQELVRQSVALQGAAREMTGQYGAALLDRGEESFNRPAGADRLGQRVHRLVPHFWPDLIVDPCVGNNFRIALRRRSEDQDAGAVLGLVQPLRKELTYRLGVCALVL